MKKLLKESSVDKEKYYTIKIDFSHFYTLLSKFQFLTDFLYSKILDLG